MHAFMPCHVCGHIHSRKQSYHPPHVNGRLDCCFGRTSLLLLGVNWTLHWLGAVRLSSFISQTEQQFLRGDRIRNRRDAGRTKKPEANKLKHAHASVKVRLHPPTSIIIVLGDGRAARSSTPSSAQPSINRYLKTSSSTAGAQKWGNDVFGPSFSHICAHCPLFAFPICLKETADEARDTHVLYSGSNLLDARPPEVLAGQPKHSAIIEGTFRHR